MKGWLCGGWMLTALAIGMGNDALGAPAAEREASKQPATWSSLITPEQLHAKLDNPRLLILDARDAAAYAQGHIPGAVNLPGSQWRTPATKEPNREGIGQQIFRTKTGELDVDRYNRLLSAAGVQPDHEIVVYGNYAGKADGSVAAAILLKLGHKSVAFLDGVGAERWTAAGYTLSNEARRLPASDYRAIPDAKRLWSRDDVLKHLNRDDVVIIDSRTPEEYAGADLRGNKRGGHIPGAVSLDSDDFLKADKTTIDVAEAKRKVEAVASKDKTVVIYCQSGTRCSHKELLLRDLGYENVVLYDASWQEWGNLDDVPVEKPTSDAPTKQ